MADPVPGSTVKNGRWMPSRKVGGGVVVGTPYAVIALWLLQAYLGPEKPIPPEVATSIGAIIGGLTAYLFPEK